MSNCIFCSIVAGNIPCYKVYEDEHVLAFLDISCDYMGHTLVVPKTHCVNMLDATPETLLHVNMAVQAISRHYVDNCGFSGVNVFANCGSDAGQSVMHLHMHIIPRKSGDNCNPLVEGKGVAVDLASLAHTLAL